MIQLYVKLKFSPNTPSPCNVLQAGGRGFQFPMGTLEFFIDLNPSSRTMALGSNQERVLGVTP